MTTTLRARRVDQVPLDNADYTTGQVGRLLKVAPRTVAKWCDAGAIPYHRIGVEVGEGSRRIGRRALIDFCAARGIPCPLNDMNRRLLVVDPSPVVAETAARIGAGWEVRGAPSAIRATSELVQWRPAVVLIDTRIGLGASAELAELAAGQAETRRVVALVHEDGPDAVPHCTRVVRLPCPPALLLDALGVGGA